MNVTVLYFAGLRESLGVEREALRLPDAVDTAAGLREWLRARGGAWSEAFADGRAVRVAVDQALAAPSASLHEGAEVAFFPPVTGG
ncbi:MAG: molybdopterin converting factor subunit 1 [Burkholderiaceae bacterium]|nr:molybdopterin converting factor subunit 1 [Burkholderiaceae bacterium]